MANITLARQLMEKNVMQQLSAIDNDIHIARERSLADAEHYRSLKEAEANRLRLTPEFLEYTHIVAIANNTKVRTFIRSQSSILDYY